jgi:hypothetical protein
MIGNKQLRCFLQILLLFLLMSFFFGCPSVTGNDGEDIDVKGMWTGTDFNGDFTFTISNTEFGGSYNTGETVHGDIVKYDNTANFLIALIDEHFVPEFIGKYVKNEWLSDPGSTFDMQNYKNSDTASGAEAETTVVWGPYTLTKQ